MKVTRSQTLIVFEEGTPQSKIDWHVRRNSACGYWTSPPPFLRQRIIDEQIKLPYVLVETWEEEVPDDN